MMDWEVYTTPKGYRAELLRGRCHLATVRGRSKLWLYARMLAVQWAYPWWAVLRAEVHHAWYLVRPYDHVTDRRRWRWQRSMRCGWFGARRADRGRGRGVMSEALGVRSLRAMARYREHLAAQMTADEEAKLIAEIPDAPLPEPDDDEAEGEA